MHSSSIAALEPEDVTARRLFDAGRATESAPPPTRATGPRPSNAAAAVTIADSAAAAEVETEVALRYLEAEWAMRMEAPLSALANLETTVSEAIDDAHAALPRSEDSA